MKVFGLDEQQVHNVVKAVSDRLYDGNLTVRDSDDLSNSRGTRATFTLRVINSRPLRPRKDGRPGLVVDRTELAPGARRSAAINRSERVAGAAACWHAHYYVIEALFIAGATRVKTAMADYRPTRDAAEFGDPVDDVREQMRSTAFRNVGSMMYPAYPVELCDCEPRLP